MLHQGSFNELDAELLAKMYEDAEAEIAATQSRSASVSSNTRKDKTTLEPLARLPPSRALRAFGTVLDHPGGLRGAPALKQRPPKGSVGTANDNEGWAGGLLFTYCAAWGPELLLRPQLPPFILPNTTSRPCRTVQYITR